MQKKVQEIQDEIKVLSTSNIPDHHTQLTAETIEPLTNADCASSMKNLPDKLVKHGKILEVSTNIPLQLSVINGIFSVVIRYSHKIYACARYSWIWFVINLFTNFSFIHKSPKENINHKRERLIKYLKGNVHVITSIDGY